MFSDDSADTEKNLKHPSSLTCLRRTELVSCVKVEVAVLGSPSLIIPTVYVDVKQHLKKKKKKKKPPPRGRTETIWVNREVELGFHGLSWAVFCFRLFSTVGSVDTVSVT